MDKKYVIGGAMLVTLLLYKLGLKSYTVTESEYKKLNNANLVGSPLSGKLKITSPFGWRNFGGGQFHNGVDLVPTNTIKVEGTPIIAPLAGTISDNYFNDRGGNQVVIDSGFAKFGFAHLQSKSPLKKGDKVKKGQLIGYLGNTGTSTGAHLHFVLRLDGEIVDPVKNITSLKNAIAKS
jgi:murein DD-endopeptidase MepM/ murein hydrolase activator NlpD